MSLYPALMLTKKDKERGGTADQFSCEKIFRDGDLIWAKAFAYTWWPGRIETTKGSLAFVSFYGCGKIRWVRASEIRAFEEYYVRMVKMGGAKLPNAFDLALKDFERRTALGLTCSCRNPIRESSECMDDHIVESRKRFDLSEMLDFVLDMAVGAWAICCFADNHNTGSDPEAVCLLHGYRLFVSVYPSRLYQQIMELEHTFLSEESEEHHHEMSDSSSDSEIIVGGWKEIENYFFYDKEEDLVVVQEKIHECKEICVVNREDFSLLDLDEQFEPLLDNKQVEKLADCGGSICENTYTSEYLEMQPSSSGI
ncbi:hypothetical protein Cni_G04637 [Canna indica]|uniref:PWWP domain-containing protein n=1 Tax=Canna indica TaxID=4628 RepID=A0AAQ3JXF6_9LILI|nr:hypothetical protein Cni_G04637 [Canna indica]